MHDGHQGLLRGFAWLKETGEIAALEQLGHFEVQRAQTDIESALSIPVPPGRALVCPFVLCEKPERSMLVLGHRGLRSVMVEAVKRHPTIHLGGSTIPYTATGVEITPRPRTRPKPSPAASPLKPT